MDDDLDLLRDPDGDGAPHRRPWPLLAAALVVALVAVAGLVWVVGSMVGGDTEIEPAAASPTATTPAPETTTTTSLPPVPTRTVASPSPTSTHAVSTIQPPVPTRTPSPTPTPTPTVRRPTLPPPPPPNPKLVRVPDVVGLRLPAATLTLRAAGFRVSVPGAVGPAPKPDQRRVSAQRPAGGSLAPKGSTVVLVLDSS